jgi:epoxyqueuosine reductase
MALETQQQPLTQTDDTRRHLMDTASVTAGIKATALALGYDACGIIPADSLKEYSVHLDRRIERFPQSRGLYESLHDLSSPDKKTEWAKSIVVCLRRYNKYRIPAGLDQYFGKLYLFDGRLKCSDEYKSAALFETYLTDLGLSFFKGSTAARLAAVKAGLGQFGKNNFLYTEHGSWVVVDTWTVDAELGYEGPVALEDICPKNCRKCIDACPTGALSEPFAMDRGICVAQLSFFSSELPPDHLREQMGTWLYGCDVCQDACPKNRKKWVSERDFPELAAIADLLTPEKIVEMDDETFLDLVQPRFWYIGKDDLWLWKCNALRAMANSGDAKHDTRMKAACKDSDENVRTMARWACERVGI